jgi:hypothetical protein
MFNGDSLDMTMVVPRYFQLNELYKYIISYCLQEVQWGFIGYDNGCTAGKFLYNFLKRK